MASDVDGALQSEQLDLGSELMFATCPMIVLCMIFCAELKLAEQKQKDIDDIEKLESRALSH